jgi:hypothetical protein
MTSKFGTIESRSIRTARLLAKQLITKNIVDYGSPLCSIRNLKLSGLSSLNYKTVIVKSDRAYNSRSVDTLSNKLYIKKEGITIKIQKNILPGQVYGFDVINSLNTFINVDRPMIPNADNFTTSLIINKSMFDNDDTVIVNFTLNLKYIGLFVKCTNNQNTSVTGNLNIKKDINGNYSITSFSVIEVNYNANDFCDQNFSEYYYYDVPPQDELDVGVSDVEQSELNIYNIVNTMLTNATLNVLTDTINIDFSLNNFHEKVSIPTILFSYINRTPQSPLTFIFDNVYTVVAVRNSPGGFVTLPTSSTMILKYLTSGDKINMWFITNNIIKIEITSNIPG